MQATWAARGELLGQVEHGVWQPLLQRPFVLLSIVLAQPPGEFLVVIDGLIQLLYRGPWEMGQLCSAGSQGPEWGICLGRGSPHWTKGQELVSMQRS